jgi:hypothetical protein
MALCGYTLPMASVYVHPIHTQKTDGQVEGCPEVRIFSAHFRITKATTL